jgi:hypothetical protein
MSPRSLVWKSAVQHRRVAAGIDELNDTDAAMLDWYSNRHNPYSIAPTDQD